MFLKLSTSLHCIQGLLICLFIGTLDRIPVPAKLQNPVVARSLFEASGLSVAEWARRKGFSTGLVYQVLDGQRKCLRGQSHQIAVALGLKQGEAMEVEELSRRLQEAGRRGCVAESGGIAIP